MKTVQVKKKAGNRDCPLTRLGSNTKHKNKHNVTEHNIESEMTKTKWRLVAIGD
jgi:hypothetical protein